MRRGVAERGEVVLEPARHHVQVHTTPVEKSQRRDHLGRGVRVHVDGLHGDERAEPLRVLDDDLRGEPGVHEQIGGVHEDALASRPLAPAGGVRHLPEVGPRLGQIRLRTSREDLDVSAIPVGAHDDSRAVSVLAPYRKNRASADTRCAWNAVGVTDARTQRPPAQTSRFLLPDSRLSRSHHSIRSLTDFS